LPESPTYGTSTKWGSLRADTGLLTLFNCALLELPTALEKLNPSTPKQAIDEAIDAPPHEERRVTAIPRVAAGNAGLTRFRLVCIALGFHTSLHGTTTEGQVAKWGIA
jgi:hypothetical protein